MDDKSYIMELKDNTLQFLPKMGTSIIIIIIFYIIAFLIRKLIFRLIKRNKTNDEKIKNNNNEILYELLGNIIYYVIVIVGILFALVNIGFNLNSLLIVFGSIGLAIALAIQGSITQIVSGIIILFFKYFNIGDLVQINGIMGFVDNFNLLNTSIVPPTGEKIIIPNNIITSGSFTNYFNKEKIYHDIFVTLSNNNTIDYNILTENIKSTLLKNCEYIVNDKDNIHVFISDISASGTKLFARILIYSRDFHIADVTARKLIRTLLADDNVLLLDNNYTSSSHSTYSNSS